MGPPKLGLLVAPGPPPLAGSLLAAMARWCVVRSADPRHDHVDVWLATSPAAPHLERALATGRPVAVWVGSENDLTRLSRVVEDGAPVVVVSSDVSAAAGHPGAIFVGRPRLDSAAALVLTPFVRARRREAAGLPPDLVVVLGPSGEGPSEESEALALAAAAVVMAEDRLLEALASGTPCVTDAATAARVGAVHDVEVVVAGGDPEGEARSLAADLRRAARLGLAGRRLVERCHDLALPARSLARRLGLTPSDPAARVEWLLAELLTPATSPVRRRAHEAMHGILAQEPA